MQETEDKWAAEDPAFAGLQKKYNISRKTVTRTDYEVDFINYFTRLTSPSLGAKFLPDAYLYPVRTGRLQ